MICLKTFARAPIRTRHQPAAKLNSCSGIHENFVRGFFYFWCRRSNENEMRRCEPLISFHRFVSGVHHLLTKQRTMKPHIKNRFISASLFMVLMIYVLTWAKTHASLCDVFDYTTDEETICVIVFMIMLFGALVASFMYITVPEKMFEQKK